MLNLTIGYFKGVMVEPIRAIMLGWVDNRALLGDLWLYWFRQRHLHLVMRAPQWLEIARAKAMNPTTVHGFYSNLLELYIKFA